jgi:hypothetical protein
MKKYLLCFLAFLLPASARAQDSFRIDEVGFGPTGIYSSNGPTPFRIHIPAQSAANTIRLEFQFEGSDTERGPLHLLPDLYLETVHLQKNIPKDIVVPLYPHAGVKRALRLVVTDASGLEIGGATHEMSSDFGSGAHLVAIYCSEGADCTKAESQLSVGIRDLERIEKRKMYAVAPFQQPYDEWWAYGVADIVILPGSISGLTTDQRSALEMYLRAGGTLVLLEKEIADKSFLAAYRKQTPSPVPIVVGRGRLIRLSGLDGGELSGIFNSKPPRPFGNGVWENAQNSGQQRVLDKVGVTFTFPRLRWLMIWLGIFIIIIGPLNFTCLRRLGKLEWGWISTSVIALSFAAALYIMSSRQRPKDFTLDSVAVYWMDDKSPVAFAHYGFRVFSPEHRSIALTMNDDAVLSSPSLRSIYGSGVNIGTEFSRIPSLGPGIQFQLQTPSQITFPMLRWSSEDFFAAAPRPFPGTVHWASPMHLKNDTLLTFRDGIFYDFKSNKQYRIPLFPPGDLADLGAFETKPIHNDDGAPIAFKILLFGSFAQIDPQEVIDTSLHSKEEGPIFIGWTNSPVAGANLDVPTTHRPTAAVFAVALDQQ